MVTTHSPLDMMGYGFLWAVCTDNVQVCCLFVAQHSRDGDEEHGVGARGLAIALCKVMNLCGIGSLPEMAIRTVTVFG